MLLEELQKLKEADPEHRLWTWLQPSLVSAYPGLHLSRVENPLDPGMPRAGSGFQTGTSERGPKV